MALIPPPADNASLPAWVRDELFPWTQGVEASAQNLNLRLDTLTQKGIVLRDRTERLRDKLLAALHRLQSVLPVKGLGAPTIYDELAHIRNTLANLELPPEEWPDAN